MKTLSFFSFLFALFPLHAQQPGSIRCPQQDCGRFHAFIAAAQAASDGREPRFDEAITQYNAARVCCPSAALTIDSLVLEVFKMIERQRDMAVKAEKRANSAEKKAKANLEKANKLIGYFGFSQNRAWAYKDGKFAVIDHKGEKKTDFIFESPGTFQLNGHALARKGGAYLLVDTNGRTSPEYEYLFPTNNGLFKAKKDKKYTFVDFQGDSLPGVGWYDVIDTFSSRLAKVVRQGKYGFINTKGVRVIPPRFVYASAFSQGAAWAKSEEEKSGLIDEKGNYIVAPEFSYGEFIAPGLSHTRKAGKWGVIDTSGRYVASPEFDYIADFREGMAIVVKDGKRGYIDSTGRLAVALNYDVAAPFSEDLAPVKTDSLWGFIDKAGKTIIPHRFPVVNVFLHGLAVAQQDKNGKYGYIDKTGTFAIAPQFDVANGFYDSVAWVMQNRKNWLIDKTGHILSETGFDGFYSHLFSENLTAVRNENKWGFINRSGRIVIPLQFNETTAFYGGLAAVRKDGNWGYINRHGEWAITPRFKDAGNFSQGVAIVLSEQGWGLINKKGEYLTDNQYNGQLNTISEGLASLEKDYKWSYFDTTGKIVLSGYDYATPFQEGLAWVTSDSIAGYMDKSGRFIFKQPSDSGLDDSRARFSNGRAAVLREGKWGFINRKGEWVVSPQFDESQQFRNGLAFVASGAENGLMDNAGNFMVKGTFRGAEPAANHLFKIRGDNGLWGYINLKNKTLIEPQFTYTNNFSEGVAWVAQRKKMGTGGFYRDFSTEWGLIDENGRFLVRPRFDDIRDFEGGTAWVQKNYVWGLIDTSGKYLKEPQMAYAGNFSEGLAWAEQDGMIGYVDRKGNLVIPFQFYKHYYKIAQDLYFEGNYLGYAGYVPGDGPLPVMLNASDKTGDFSGGLAPAWNGEKWGYINRSGDFAIAPQFDWAFNFSEARAWVKKGGKWGVIDDTGAFILPLQYDWGISFSGGFAPFFLGRKCGLADRSGNIVAQPQYEAIAYFSEGLAAAKKEGKWGYLDWQGREIIPPQFDDAWDFFKGKAKVRKFDEYFVINKKGQLIVDEVLEPVPAGDSGPKPDDR